MGTLKAERARYFTSVCLRLLHNPAASEGSLSYEDSPPIWISR